MWYPDDLQHLQSLSQQVSRWLLRRVQGLRLRAMRDAGTGTA
jgi:hypothetical protein